MPLIPQGVFLGVGNALLDICAVVEDEFLKKYDVFMNTSSLAEERHMGLFRDLVDDFMPTFVASGSAQNAVRVCQWMLMSPGATSYMGCIGRDEYGDTMKHCLSADGVNVHFMEEPSLTTGTLATLVNVSGERALIANLAAANSFSEDHLHTDKAVHFISASRFIYIPGFFIVVIIFLSSFCFKTKRGFDSTTNTIITGFNSLLVVATRTTRRPCCTWRAAQQKKTKLSCLICQQSTSSSSSWLI
jgi:hypothetical protein